VLSLCRKRLLCALVAVASILTARNDAASPSIQSPAPAASRTGILLLAHGGKDSWNEEVRRVARAADEHAITEVAFGMADRTEIQAAIGRLEARGATTVTAVPLFVSSHSSVITSTRYLLGLLDAAPPELATYARMRHGGAGHHGAHGTGAPDPERMRPVDTRLPVRMTPALDRHPLVAGILLSRAQSISHSPRGEAVILVAHGPVTDEANARWLADMTALAEPLALPASRGSCR